MPIIVAKKEGTCRACGGRIRKGEYAHFEAGKGAAHPEPDCVHATARVRPNSRAATCSCGTFVEAGKGRLRLVDDGGAQGGRKRWAVDCARCAGL